MARYTGAVCRLCRREGKKLFLKGERCFSDKCSVSLRSYAPGQHGQSRKKVSEYGLQLREKQMAKRYYNVSENQFYKYFEMAERKPGMTGETFSKFSNPVWITLSTEQALLLPERKQDSLCCTTTSASTARKSTFVRCLSNPAM